MANILGGIAVSHTPTIGFAVDHHKQRGPGVVADLPELRTAAALAGGEKTGCAGVHL